MTADYTIKDIADIVEVSKTTIRKVIKNENIKYDYIKNNKQFYSEAKARQIIEVINPNCEFANSQTQFANSQFDEEIPQTKTANSQTEFANSKTEELDLLKKTLELLGRQLEEKDKQLMQKDKQIDALNERLKEAMAVAQQQNYITATDKTTQLLEAQVEGKREERKSIFARIFNR